MSIQLKKTVLFSILSLLFQSSFVTAGECNFIQLLKNKSPGTDVIQSNCSKENTLSISNQLSIAAGGRIWLESGENETATKQQVICQNRSLTPVLLQITDLQAPWLSTTEINNCNAWANNRLTCDIADGQKFFCITAELKVKIPNNTRQERTTSVAMRSLTGATEDKELNLNLSSEENYIKSTINALKSEINLCRELYNSQAPIEFYWNIKSPNKVRDLSVLTEGQKGLSQCMKDVVANHQYEITDETILFTHKF